MDNVKKVNNPLTIIAIFAGLAEIVGTTVLLGLTKEIQEIFVWFVMIFPILLVIAFFVTLNWNHKVLYAPSDYRDEKNFVDLWAQKQKIKDNISKFKEIIDEVMDPSNAESNDNEVLKTSVTKKIDEVQSDLERDTIDIDLYLTNLISKKVSELGKVELEVLKFISDSWNKASLVSICSELKITEHQASRIINKLQGNQMIFKKGKEFYCHPMVLNYLAQ